MEALIQFINLSALSLYCHFLSSKALNPGVGRTLSKYCKEKANTTGQRSTCLPSQQLKSRRAGGPREAWGM